MLKTPLNFRILHFSSAFGFATILLLCGSVAHANDSQIEIRDETYAASLDEALNDDHSLRLEAFKDQVANGADMHQREIFVYDCKYIQATNLRRVLEEFISSDGMVAESSESDQIVLSDTAQNLEMMKKIIERLDQPVPQILVEARIVELNIDSDLEKEVDLFYEGVGNDLLSGDLTLVDEIGSKLGVAGAAPNTGQGGIVNSQIWDNDTEALNLFIRYLETNGKAKILSAPNLIIQRGKEGSIVTGEEVPILSQTTSSGGVTTSTEFKSVGIKLNVKPTMIAGDRIRLEVNPEVSTVIGFSVAGEVSNPIIAVRQARTELEVRDGQLISMAGLLQSTDRDTKRRTPGLSKIPLLGTLFKSDRRQSEQTQLIIFLNIKILEFGEETIIQPDAIDPVINDVIEGIESKNDQAVEEASLVDDVKTFFDLNND
ncbi:MAG: type II secretion system protein GspD [Opitutaceae bacterium]